MRKHIFIALLLILSLAAQAQVPDQSWWTFQFPQHRANDTSRLDLRYLNERESGEHGFIKLAKGGNSLIDGKGKPMRFWAANGGSLARGYTDRQLDSLARSLAKMGVNMVRYHGAINPATGSISIKNKQIRKAVQLDAAGYAVRELKLLVTADGVRLDLPKDAMYILLER